MWSKEEILMATGGRIAQDGETGIFGEVVTDSRRVKPGSVFVALRGERFDGHAFLKEAYERGARCFVVQKVARLQELKGATIIRTRATLEALGDLAHYRRKKLGPVILAVTGSNGKTTTKEMVAAILEKGTLGGKPLRGHVLKTEGNLNNLVGLPLTLLRLSRKERVGVVELGTSNPGEIGRLTEIADPDAGLITSVAAAHLAGLGSLAGVAREKGDLFRRMKRGATAVVNLDDPRVRRLGKKFKGRKMSYGEKGAVRGRDWRPLGIRGAEFTLRVRNQSRRIRLRLCGRHNLCNAVGAAALAHSAGMDLSAIEKGLRSVKPFPMRMEMEQWRGLRIINDAYNANPASMEAALRTLGEMPGRGKRFAVLGDMLELGRASARSHRRLGEAAARFGIDRLLLLGRQAGQVKRGAAAGGMKEDFVIIGKDHREIARHLKEQARKGDWLLFKGSRGMQMEKALAEFKELGE